MKFAQYDVVMLKNIHLPELARDNPFSLRPPRIGDVATIVETYSDPPGYELECSDGNGITQWMVAFSPNDVELELFS